MIEKLSARVIGMIVGAILLVVAIGLFVHSCDKRRSQGAQTRVERGQAGALQNSAADAIGTVQGVGGNEASSEALTRSNERDIRNAPGANDPVNSAARDAGLHALCLRRAYRDSPKCRLQQSPSR